MTTRRDFLKTCSLLGFGATVPQFLARTAHAATPGKDTILVVVEMTGGNDGLNMVIPYADDLYHKARPTLRQTKDQVVKLNDHVGLNSGMAGLRQMIADGHLAAVQGVGYPNPDRSHFEAMDIWHSADPKRAEKTGWLGRAAGVMTNRGGPILHVGSGKSPLAAAGAPGTGAISLGEKNTFRLELGDDGKRKADRRKLLEGLAAPAKGADDDLLAFVQRQQVGTLTAVETLQELFEGPNAIPSLAPNPNAQPGMPTGPTLDQKFQIIAGLIAKGFGTRIYYVTLDGFDTHANQAPAHLQLLGELANGIAGFFAQLKATRHDDRVRVMTFSEFGRRVAENGSRGTDHGAGSCMLVAGPSVKGGVVGKHPKLDDLDAGDLKYHIDFRSVYATLLDEWLGADSKAVLGAKWDHVKELGVK